MLSTRDVKVTHKQLDRFLHLVQEICPWFPEGGTVNIQTWEKIGQQLKTFYSLHGPSKVPVDTFSFWNLIRDCLDPTHEIQKLFKAASLRRFPSAPQLQNLPEEPVSPTAPPLLATMPSSESLEDDDELSPEDETELEEEAARYHNPDFDDGIFAALKNVPAESENFPILDKTSFTALAQALTWVKHFHDVTQDASLAPIAHSSGSSLPAKAPDESPSVNQGSISVSSTSSLPVSLSSPLQTALFQASKQGEDISSLGFENKEGGIYHNPAQFIATFFIYFKFFEHR